MKNHFIYKTCAILFFATTVISCKSDPVEPSTSLEPQDTIWAQSAFPEGWGVVAFGIAFGHDIYAGSYGPAYSYGTFRSNDKGISWEELGSGLTGISIRGIVNRSDGYVVAATNDNPGLSSSIDSGQTWENIDINDVGFWAVSANSHGHIFASTKASGVFRTTDNGQSWMQIRTGLGFFNAYIAFAITDSDIVFMGGDGLFRSTNDGDSWTYIDSTLTLGFVFALAISPAGEVVAATQNGIFLSGDNGNTWTKKRNEATSLVINARGDIFVGFDYGPGVFRSTDNGTTWTEFGLRSTAVENLAIDSTGFLYASPASGLGLFRTKSSTMD